MGMSDMTSTVSKKRSVTQRSYPIRNIQQLYCSPITYNCARGTLASGTKLSDLPTAASLNTPCISCAYKIANFDIALDAEFTKRVANVRPECCPRSQLDRSNYDDDQDASRDTMGHKSVIGYVNGMSVLTVGDGDFTFSTAIARLVASGKSGGKVIATSYEDKSILQNVYPDFTSTLNELDQYNVKVCYKVDATSLDGTLPTYLSINTEHESERDNNTPRDSKYHRIIWNFPCTAISSGQDGQNSAMNENKGLIRKFVSNALSYLKRDGEILMAHKTKPPFCQWELEKVALQDLNENESNVFEYKGRIVFDKCLLKPYTPRKALDRKSFPCHDACVYVFGWKMNNKITREFDSTIPEDKRAANVVMPVTDGIIDELRSLHLRLAEMKESQKNKSTGIKKRRLK